MSLTASIKGECRASQSSTTGGVSYTGSPFKTFSLNFSSSDITKMYHGSRTSASETLDLTSGLTDGFGNALVFTQVKELFIINNSATQTMTIGGGTSPTISQLPDITPGGQVHLTTNITVDGTHKNLKVANTGSLTYDIIVLGN